MLFLSRFGQIQAKFTQFDSDLLEVLLVAFLHSNHFTRLDYCSDLEEFVFGEVSNQIQIHSRLSLLGTPGQLIWCF